MLVLILTLPEKSVLLCIRLHVPLSYLPRFSVPETQGWFLMFSHTYTAQGRFLNSCYRFSICGNKKKVFDFVSSIIKFFLSEATVFSISSVSRGCVPQFPGRVNAVAILSWIVWLWFSQLGTGKMCALTLCWKVDALA